MFPVSGPLESATLSVEEASTDIRGRYGGDCKTAYTGSIPVVASNISRTRSGAARGTAASRSASCRICNY